MTRKIDEDVGELSYRDVQHQLKALGLPAKGPDAVLRERLTEAWSETSPANDRNAEETQPKSVKSPKSPKSPKKAPSPKAQVKVRTIRSPRRAAKEEETEDPVVPEPKEEEEAEGAGSAEGTEAKKQRANRRSIDNNAGRKTKSPAPRRRQGRVSLIEEQVPSTPVEQIKRIARYGTAHVRKSFGNLEQEFKRRKVPIWPFLVLPLLLLLFLAGSQRDSWYWHRHINSQLKNINYEIASFKEHANFQARKISQGAYNTYEKLRRSASHGTERVKSGADSVLHKAFHYLPSQHKLPGSACSARLNVTTLAALFSEYPSNLGFSTTIQDAWKGHKENSLKATGILLAGKNTEQIEWATTVVKHAVPPDCASCYLQIQGEDYNAAQLSSAGRLQASLADHVKSCPNAIVHIEMVNRIHPDNLSALLNAMSEQGSLASMGKSVATHNVLFVGSSLVPASTFTKEGEEEFAAAVKRDLVLQLDLAASPSSRANSEAFRRRWDYVAPILQKVH